MIGAEFEETEWKAGPHLLKKTGAQRAHEESDLEQDYVPGKNQKLRVVSVAESVDAESFDQVLKHAPTVAKQQPSAQKPPQKSDLEVGESESHC